MGAPLARFVDAVMRRNADAPSQMRAIAFVMAAWLALWRGELPQAMERVMQAQEDERWLGMPTRLRMFVGTVRAAVNAVCGERDATFDALAAPLAYFDAAPLSGPSAQPTSMYAHYLFFAARLADTLGDSEALRDFAARVPPPDRSRTSQCCVRRSQPWPRGLRLSMVVTRKPAFAGPSCSKDEAALDVLGLAHEGRLRYAHALLALERRTDAAAALKPVLDAVAQTGEIGGVLLAGRRVLSALAQADWRNELEWTELEMLRGWAQRFSLAALAEPLAHGPVDAMPLSPRELQVLARIAAGDSNKLIARAFDLSPHTVKRHVANILGKLGVGSRSQAAQWYRARN